MKPVAIVRVYFHVPTTMQDPAIKLMLPTTTKIDLSMADYRHIKSMMFDGQVLEVVGENFKVLIPAYSVKAMLASPSS